MDNIYIIIFLLLAAGALIYLTVQNTLKKLELKKFRDKHLNTEQTVKGLKASLHHLKTENARVQNLLSEAEAAKATLEKENQQLQQTLEAEKANHQAFIDRQEEEEKTTAVLTKEEKTEQSQALLERLKKETEAMVPIKVNST